MRGDLGDMRGGSHLGVAITPAGGLRTRVFLGDVQGESGVIGGEIRISVKRAGNFFSPGWRFPPRGKRARVFSGKIQGTTGAIGG